MEFGLQIGGMSGGSMAALIEAAKLADASGFRWLSVPDHFVLEQPGSGIDPSQPSYEAMTMLGALAAVTEHVRVGGMVVCNMFRFMLMITDTRAAGDAIAAGMGPMFGVAAADARRVPLALIGTPDEIVEELRRREREWGMTLTIVSGARRDAATLGRFATEILPHV